MNLLNHRFISTIEVLLNRGDANEIEKAFLFYRDECSVRFSHLYGVFICLDILNFYGTHVVVAASAWICRLFSMFYFLEHVVVKKRAIKILGAGILLLSNRYYRFYLFFKQIKRQ